MPQLFNWVTHVLNWVTHVLNGVTHVLNGVIHVFNWVVAAAGQPLSEASYTWDKAAHHLIIHKVPDRAFQVTAVTTVHPEQHTDLEGLFCVGGVYATQVSMCTSYVALQYVTLRHTSEHVYLIRCVTLCYVTLRYVHRSLASRATRGNSPCH